MENKMFIHFAKEASFHCYGQICYDCYDVKLLFNNMEKCLLDKLM